MSMTSLGRAVGMVVLSVVIAGCASSGTGGGGGVRSLLPAFLGGTEDCSNNRRACLYDGAYEPGERQYAEQEARRLNMAELERFRRSTSR